MGRLTERHVKITGQRSLIQKLERLGKRVVEDVRQAQRVAAEEMHARIQRDVDQPFQSVVSYVYESLMGLPGTKVEFADPDLIGTFAKRAPKLVDPWTKQVQIYRKGGHPLRDRLAVETHDRGRQIIASVGYPPDMGRGGRDTRYVIWVLFGTTKMQPRPFLQIALDEYGEGHLDRIADVVSRSLDRATGAAGGGP